MLEGGGGDKQRELHQRESGRWWGLLAIALSWIADSWKLNILVGSNGRGGGLQPLGSYFFSHLEESKHTLHAKMER